MIRLRVAYHSAQALVTEYTACLTRGGCLLAAHKPVEVGSVFVFEMTCSDSLEPAGFVGAVEVQGEVVRVRPIYGATLTYELAVQYRTTGAERPALEAMLSRIEVARGYTVVREFPRIPVNLLAEDSQGGGRYFVRDVSRGGMRVESQDGHCEAVLDARVLLGVRLCAVTAPLVFVGGAVRWLRGVEEGNVQFGVEFDEIDSLSAPQRMVLEELTRLVRPYQVFLHLGGLQVKKKARDEAAPTSPRWVAATELTVVVAEMSRQELSVALGLEVVERPVPELEPSASYTARIGLTGDLDGELELRASVELCVAIASQLVGDEVSPQDEAGLEDALCEFVVGLGGAFCDRLEASGHDVAITAPLAGQGPAEEPGDRIHTVSLAGPRGVAVFTVRSHSPRRGAARQRKAQGSRPQLLRG